MANTQAFWYFKSYKEPGLVEKYTEKMQAANLAPKTVNAAHAVGWCIKYTCQIMDMQENALSVPVTGKSLFL